MFEQPHSGGAGDDPVAAPGLPATVEVSPCWREAAPGPELMAGLAAVSLPSCTDAELLDVLAGWERAAAWLAAQRARALVCTEARLLDAAVQEEKELNGRISWTAVHRQAETEIATALRWTSRFTLARLHTAQDLTGRLPQVLDALTAGQVSYRHAEAFCEETGTLTDGQARRVADRLLPGAATATVPGLRRRLRKACLRVDPDTANERAAQAVTERSVTIRSLPDGQAQLQAIGPADAILGMFRVLHDTAARAPQDDPRTTTARRFDTLLDAVLTTAGLTTAGLTTAGLTPAGLTPAGPRQGCPAAPKIPALVQVTTDLETLYGLRDNPAELHGYGPLPAALARTLAADATWQRFLRDPVTGAPQDLGRTRRHPTAELRRWILTRDQTCLFPGCYRPAARCEPDHNPAWDDGGGTDKATLNALCRKHHKVRHHGWHYQRHPDRISWTSPTGQTYQRYLTEADLAHHTDPHPAHSNDPDPDPPPPAPHQDEAHEQLDDEQSDDEQIDDSVWLPYDDDQQISIEQMQAIADEQALLARNREQARQSLPDEPPF